MSHQVSFTLIFRMGSGVLLQGALKDFKLVINLELYKMNI